MLSPEVVTPEIKLINWRCHPHERKPASKVVRSSMQFTLHAIRRTPHGASRSVQAMSAWSVKTRRAPSRHRRNAMVYDHTPTATHYSECTPLPDAAAVRCVEPDPHPTTTYPRFFVLFWCSQVFLVLLPGR